MGKVAKPLTIVVFPPLDEWPEIVKLQGQGHTIISMADTYPTSDLIDCDIILGPRCWMMAELHRKHLTQAIKQARLRKYGTVAKRKGKDDHEENKDIEGRTGVDNPGPESAGC